MPRRRAKYVFSVIKWYIPKLTKSSYVKKYVSQENISRLFESRNCNFLSKTVLAPKLELVTIINVDISLEIIRLNNFNEGDIEWVWNQVGHLVVSRSNSALLTFCRWGNWVLTIQFSCSVASDFLQPHGLQHTSFPARHQLPELAQTHVHESVMPSNHLIFCRPLLLLPSVFLRIRVFSSESVLRIRWPKDWSFSFSISPPNEYSGLISFRIDGYYRTTDGVGPGLESRSIWHQSPASKKKGSGCLREDTLGDGETRPRAGRLGSAKAHVTVWRRTDGIRPTSESRQCPLPAKNWSAQHILSSQWMLLSWIIIMV